MARGRVLAIACIAVVVLIAIATWVIVMQKQYRRGEAESARIMASLCVTRAAAQIFHRAYKSEGNFPEDLGSLRKLAYENSQAIDCSSYYPHFDGSTLIDSFGNPVEYWFGNGQLAVFSRSPIRHYPKVVRHVYIFIVDRDGVIPASIDCSDPNLPTGIVPADLIKVVCAPKNTSKKL